MSTSSQKRGHEIECIWAEGAAGKLQFCLQGGKGDWSIHGARQVLCDRNPFPMVQNNKIKVWLIALSRSNLYNSDIKFVLLSQTNTLLLVLNKLLDSM